MYAAISPRDNAVALFRDDGFVSVLNPQGSSLADIPAERYFARHRDTSIATVTDAKHAVDILARHSEMSLCLDMTLLLFDHDITVQTRGELATELDRLLRSNENREYVLDVTLTTPFPADADRTGATSAVKGHAVVGEVVTTILDSQDAVQVVFNSWLLIRDLPLVKQNGADKSFAILSRHSVFRRFAIEARDHTSLSALTASLAMDESLKRQLDAAPRIVVDLAKQLKPHLRHAQQSAEAIGLPTVKRSRLPINVTFEESLPQHHTGHAAFLAAVSQVEKISDLYRQLKDQQASSMLQQLVTEQLKHEEGEEYLVKSLCNIANRVNARGRPEIGLECLMKALQFPNGIDAQLYFQIGNELRELRQFDESIKCYRHAKQLDDGSLADQIRLAIIRVTVAKGRYEEALSAYLEIPDLRLKPMELSGLGTLYRKMGRLRDAREEYTACLKIADDFHLAHAGLGEVKKQIGRPHEAIAQYNALLRRFTDIDDGPRKVYELARSQLFRMTKQYDKSEAILRELAATFPGDRGVHTQFAQLLALRGQMKEAQEHFKMAKGKNLHDLGQLIFAKVNRESRFEYSAQEFSVACDSLLPEERGLASCAEAYDLLRNSEYRRAQEELRDSTFVDRLTSDLASVLRFHAQQRCGANVNYKSEYALCRVAKRSDRSLRNAIQAIAAGNYADAVDLEREFLLRIAA